MENYHPGKGFTFTSSYGPRVIEGEKKFHDGYDFAAPRGTPIPAAVSGVVHYVGWSSSFGNTVVIKTTTAEGGHYFTLYGHGTGKDMPKLGSTVKAGQKIGEVGNTGSRSKGDHLHFSIYGEDAPVSNANGGLLWSNINYKQYFVDPAKFNKWGTGISPYNPEKIAIKVPPITYDKKGNITGYNDKCFVAGTLILMANGEEKPIESIVSGDKVMAFDDLGALFPGTVTEIFTNRADNIIHLSNGLRATEDHPFLGEDGKFYPLKEMLAQNIRAVLSDGSFIELSGESLKGTHEVYNFTVRDYHTYIAGGFRVHNESILHFYEDGAEINVYKVDDPKNQKMVMTLKDGTLVEIIGKDIDGDGNTDLLKRTETYGNRDGSTFDLTLQYDKFVNGIPVVAPKIIALKAPGFDYTITQIGETFGSQLAALTAGDNLFKQIGVKTLGGMIGREIGNGIGELGASLLGLASTQAGAQQTLLETAFKSGLEAAVGQALSEFSLNGANAIGSMLVGELADALNLKGFKQQGFEYVAGDFTAKFITNLYQVTTGGGSGTVSLLKGFNAANLTTSIFNAAGSIIGGYATEKLINYDTQGEALLSATGGIVGGMLLSEIPIVGTAVGTFLGQLIGSGIYEGLDAITGGKFGEWFKDDPYVYRYLTFDYNIGDFTVKQEVRHETGEVPQIVQSVRDLTDAYLKMLNGVTDSIGRPDLQYFDNGMTAGGPYHAYFGYHHGNSTTAGNDDFKVVMGHDAPGFYVNANGDIDKIVRIGMEYELRHMGFFDGDLVKIEAHRQWVRQFNGKETGDELQKLFSYLSTAEDYRKYLENTEEINALIASAGNTPFATTWAASLITADTLNFNRSYSVSNELNANLVMVDLINQGKMTDSQAHQIIEGPGGYRGSYGGGAVTNYFNANADLNYLALIELIARKLISENSLTYALSRNNTFLAADGNDEIRSYGGDDTVMSYGGNDTLYGGIGNDVIDAGNGDDTVYGGSGGVSPNDGNDVIYGGHGKDLILGNAGNDTLYGGRAAADPTDQADEIHGGKGADTIYGNGGDDMIIGGGSTPDSMDLSDVIYGGLGNDTIRGNEGGDVIYGGGTGPGSKDGADTIYGDAGGDTLYGNEGDDVIYGGTDSGNALDRADVIYGGSGNDKINSGEGGDLVYGGSGNDLIEGKSGDDVLLADEGDDNIKGGGGSDYILSGRGNDTIEGGGGQDHIYLSSGIDTITDFSSSDDVIHIRRNMNSWTSSAGEVIKKITQNGSDALIDFGKNVTLIFKNKNISDFSEKNFKIDDSYESSSINEKEELNANKVMSDAIAVNKMTGDNAVKIIREVGGYTGEIGGGKVTAYFDSNPDANYLTLLELINKNIIPSSSKTYALSLNNTYLSFGGNSEIHSYGGNDTIITMGGNDKLYGGLDDDLIDAGAGDDLVIGGNGMLSPKDGNDTLYGGRGKDDIYGNAGNDVIFGGKAPGDAGDESDTISGGAGGDLIYGNGGDDIIRGGGSTVSTTDLADVIYGETGNDTIFGNEGNDDLYGGEGNDTIDGGTENDNLFGDAGNDILRGKEGSDRIDGGFGDDSMEGGSGADIFYVSGGNDVIADFSKAEDVVYVKSEWIPSRYVGDILSRLQQTGADTRIEFSQGHSLIFKGLAPGQFEADDFSIYS